MAPPRHLLVARSESCYRCCRCDARQLEDATPYVVVLSAKNSGFLKRLRWWCLARAPQLHPPPPIFVVGGIPASLPSTRSTLDDTTPVFSGSAIACPRPACQRHCALAQSNQKGVTPAIANPPRRGCVRNLAPLPRPLCSVCLFGFTPGSYNTHKPMISQSHHHHHYQLTRDHYEQISVCKRD